MYVYTCIYIYIYIKRERERYIGQSDRPEAALKKRHFCFANLRNNILGLRGFD